MGVIAGVGTSRSGTWWGRARWAVALLLAGTALWLSFRQVSLRPLANVLAGARPGWLLLALLSVVLSTALKAARWYVLVRRCRPHASPARFARLLFMGQLANNVLPRLGDVVRAVWLGPEVEGGVAAVFGSLVVEKALDALLGLVVLLGLVLSTPLPAWLQGSLAGLAATTGALLLVLLAAHAARARLAALAQRLPAGAGQRIGRMAGDLMLGLDLLRAPGDAWLALLLSGAIWALAVMTNALATRALGIGSPAWTAWLVVVTVYAATFLPTVPAQMGVFEFAAMTAMQVGGTAPDAALAFGLVLHVVVLAPAAVLGAAAMVREGIGWRGLQAVQQAMQERGAR